jgi:hypothetical protein
LVKNVLFVLARAERPFEIVEDREHLFHRVAHAVVIDHGFFLERPLAVVVELRQRALESVEQLAIFFFGGVFFGLFFVCFLRVFICSFIVVRAVIVAVFRVVYIFLRCLVFYRNLDPFFVFPP